MFALLRAFRRKRKLLQRLGALAAVALGGLALVLPGFGAHDGPQATVAVLDADPALLFPAPISSEHFSDFSHPTGSAAELAGS